ncbi:MAG: hypothetical protein ACODTL_16210 [Brucella sp.]
MNQANISGLDLYNDIQNLGYINHVVAKQAPKAARKEEEAATGAIRLKCRDAEKFVLDDTALDLVANEMAHKPSELVHLYEHMAIPHDAIWVEFDAVALNTHRQKMGVIPFVPIECSRIGLYLTGTAHDQFAPITAQLFYLSRGQTIAAEMYFVIRPNTKHNLTAAMLNTGGKRNVPKEMVPSLLAWGEYLDNWYNDQNERMAVEQLAKLSHAKLQNYIRPLAEQHGVMGLQSIGALRYVAPIINMLNYKPLFKQTTATTGTTRKFTSTGKSVADTVTAHRWVLSMSVARAATRMRRLCIVRKPHAQHEVRDHWAYSRRLTDATCTHIWNDNGKNSQQECQKCNGLRWLKRAYVRGDAKYGTRVKTHTIVQT